MAAVIAHEVKNPLAGIRGAVQVIGSRLPQASKEFSVIGEVVARIDALNDLVHELLLFARPPKPRPAPLDVSLLVAVTVSLLANDPALSSIRVEVEGSAPPIAGDAEMLKIVFMNLLINGAQAMGGTGTLRVSVLPSAPACRIDFVDAGSGISPEIREKIFTPFLTTKARGSGLGLSISKRFIEAHHGTIEINCPADGGTIVTVWLPLARTSADGFMGGRTVLGPAEERDEELT
jgi:two-component system sensor histidine kinase HydH